MPRARRWCSLAPNHFLLELFHGPTLAFKDFAMQLIGQLFQAALARSGERVTIVGATSGDTGSAAIEAFRGLTNVDVFILYPAWPGVRGAAPPDDDAGRKRTSMRWRWMAISTTARRRVKDMFNDFAFRDGVRLAGVNSINWARVLAQVVYYFTAAVSLGAPHRAVSFTVPTGNFGDIFAGYIARGDGPADRQAGDRHQPERHPAPRPGDGRLSDRTGCKPSISPSMDIQVSSNFERALFDAYGRDGAAVAALMAELKAGGFRISAGALSTPARCVRLGRCSEDETVATIRRDLCRRRARFCARTPPSA